MSHSEITYVRCVQGKEIVTSVNFLKKSQLTIFWQPFQLIITQDIYKW